MSAIPDCANAEQQNSEPPLIVPNIRARNDIIIIATISKTLEKSWLADARIKYKRLSKMPMAKAMGRSTKWPTKPHIATHAQVKACPLNRLTFCFSVRWIV